MVDLSPNLSPYQALSKPSGVGTMDPGSLLGLIQRGRELETQQAVSDALRASGGDPNAASQSLMRPGAPGFATPGLVSDLAHASQAITETRLKQVQQIGQMISSHIDDPDLSYNKIHSVGTFLAEAGFPPSIIMPMINGMPPDSAGRKAQKNYLQDWSNYVTGGEPVTTVGVPTVGGGTTPYTGAEYNRALRTGQQPPGGGGASPGTTAAIDPRTGRPMTTLPTGSQAAFTTSAAAAGKLTDPEYLGALNQTRTNLLTLDQLSEEAATGPTAGIEMRAGELAKRFGISLPFDQAKPGRAMGQTAATEEYSKIAATLRQQMASTGMGFMGGHATDAWLGNAGEAMPHAELSKLGRSGITHYLLGLNDSMQLIPQKFGDYLAAGGQPQDFSNWLNGRIKGPDGKPYFDISTFDPRVFAYERMTPAEQQQFEKTLGNNKGAAAKFLGNLRDYEQRGWITARGLQ